METPRAINTDIDRNFQEKLMHLGSTMKERSEGNTIGQLPETGLYRDAYDVHNYDNQFQVETSIRRMMDDADRIAQEGGAYMNDRYFMDPNMDILNPKAMVIEGVENQITDLMNITPEKLNKFEAEYKGETATKRKLEQRAPVPTQNQIDENLEARIERVIEGYEKLGEMKMTVDKILNKIVGDRNDRKSLEPLMVENAEVKDLLDIIEGKADDAESKLSS